MGRTPKGNGSRILVMTAGRDVPVSAFVTAAHHAEVHTIETLVDDRVCETLPRRLLYDKAADAEWLRSALALRGVELISPHRSNRKKPPTQDGRSLRRYRRRWRIERTISWLHNFRRLVTRWDYYSDLFEGFVHLACLYTILKRL